MLPLLLTLLQAAPADSTHTVDSRATHYSGIEGRTSVAIPRIEDSVSVDGALDEVAWERAVVLGGFSQYFPVDGQPADDSTRILVWYSPRAIHFGVQAYEPHGPAVARLADRDRIASEDHVQILLDTYADGRRAFVFGVNALGIQADGIRVEKDEGGGGLLSVDQSEDPVDLSPDFLYASEGRVTDSGYEVEVAIPFASLRYPDEEVQSWRLQVIRRVQHSGHEQTWTPARRGRASFLAQSGVLEGLRDFQHGPTVDVNPTNTWRMEGRPVESGWEYGTVTPELGLNLGWAMTSAIGLNLTVNPDFSQVEADAGQLSFDPRSAVFFPEKRPFFLEGSERFETPNRLIYSRRIAEPAVAIKLTGRAGGIGIGALAAVDRSVDGRERSPLVGVLRLQRDVGAESTIGLLYTGRVVSDDANHLAGADARLVFGDVYSLSLQGAASLSRVSGESRNGVLWDFGLQRNGRQFGFTATLEGFHPDFRAAAGFVRRTGILQARLSPSLTLYGPAGGWLESWTGSVSASGTWPYRDFFGGGGPDALKLHLNGDALVRGGWQAGVSVLVERFYYPPDLYEDYAVERSEGERTDTVPFVGTPSIPNLDFVVRLATPRFSTFSASAVVIAGRDENFDEWAPARILILDGTLAWQPTGQIRVEGTYARQQYVRPGDGTTVASRDLPRLKLEYQLARPLFFRVVGQYDARYRDALRDDTRTGDPILLLDPDTGVYRRATEIRDNGLQLDWLLSYEPSPGTVFYVGYASSLEESRAFAFDDLRRTEDRLFAKLSYRLRF